VLCRASYAEFVITHVVNRFPAFMQPGGSSPLSQKSSAGSYPEQLDPFHTLTNEYSFLSTSHHSCLLHVPLISSSLICPLTFYDSYLTSVAMKAFLDMSVGHRPISRPLPAQDSITDLCLERDSNPRSQHSSGPNPYVPPLLSVRL
jgi:hypothetical protein